MLGSSRWASLLVLLLVRMPAGAVAPRLLVEQNFPQDAVVNVALPPYEAVPDDGKDDTNALQRAISENVGTGKVLFFPAGVYEISDSLVCKNAAGVWRPHVTFQGQGRGLVTLKLKDHASGFGDPAHPKAMVMTGSYWEPGDSADGGGNKAFRNSLRNMSFDTGTGNPGAMGIEWAVSNVGAIRDVTVRSGDGSGIAGIALLRRIPGPGLIKNVSISGFNVGIDLGDIQYGVTMEHVTLSAQKFAGIRTSKNVLHIRNLRSENKVPAVVVVNAEGALTLVNSEVTGSATGEPAIDCAGALLVLDLNVRGKGDAVVHCSRGNYRASHFDELVSPGIVGGGQKVKALPVEETPEFFNSDLGDWQPVGPRMEGEKDDTAAIQRAIDTGRGTIYFRNDRVYYLSDTVVVRGDVRQILGMGSELNLGAAREGFDDAAHPKSLIRIDPTHSPVVFLQDLFFNTQYPGIVVFENNTPATVVIQDCAGWVGAAGQRRSYRNTIRATGKLFIEDVFLPGWKIAGQTVWARQFNPECPDGDGMMPQVSNIGGRVWILGFKTEGPAPFIDTSAGGVTQLLGGYNYVSATQAPAVPEQAVPYLLTDSAGAFCFTTDNFRGSDYATYIRQRNGNATRDLKRSELLPRNGHLGDRSFSVPFFKAWD